MPKHISPIPTRELFSLPGRPVREKAISIPTARLESLFTTDPTAAISEVERLVQETVALVQHHTPTVDIAHLRYLNGERQKAWQPLARSFQ